MDPNVSAPKAATAVKSKSKFLGHLITFGIGFAVGIGTFWFAQWRYDFLKEGTSTDEATTTPATAESADQDDSDEDTTEYPDFALNKEIATYLVWWDQDNGFEVIKNNTANISRVSPFWYQMKADGSIEKFSGAEDEEIIAFCQENNIKIIPVITNEHDPLPVQTLFDDESLTSTHIETIVSLVKTNGYDGIEIDYESLEATDRDNYSTFMTDLSAALHAESKLLTTAVHAKSSDQGTWGGPAAQDWETLNDACDAVKIMTYDFHWSTSEAGDIAPVSWMEDVYDYAITVIDKDKIFVGVHFYGYDWVESQATDLTYEDVQELVETYSPTIKTSSEGEKYFTYTKDSETHTVYYADHETIAERIALANEYDTLGVGIWRMGQEDPENWTTIETQLGN